VIVDVYPELDFLQLRPGSFLVLLLLGNVVTELSEIDDFADRRIGGGRNFDQIQAEALSFAQGVGKLHDAELFAVGCEDDPDFSGANPTVYTNLWLQIKSKLLAGETGSEPWRRIFTAFSRPPFLTLETLLPHRGCDIAVTGLRFFAGRLEDVGNICSEQG
jgi:hypothetical protein